MAINYSNLFGDIGEMILAIEELEAFMTTVDTRRDTIISQLVSTSNDAYIGGVNTFYDNVISNLETQTEQLISLISQVLVDRDRVTEQLPQLTGSSISNVVQALITDMIENSQTIKKSTITITPGAKVTVNANAGSLVTTKVLPGNVSPSQSYLPNLNYAGVDSEIPLPDTLRIICTDDSQGGADIGSESFQITGIEPQQQSTFEFNPGGNRGITTLSVADENSIITNFFEDFTTDVPDGWTVTAGVAGTDFGEDTTNYLFGTSSLEIVNSGDTITLDYDIFDDLEPGQVMCLYFYLKRQTAATGALDYQVSINGSSVVGASITVDATYADWALVTNVFTVPDDLGTAAYVRFTTDPAGVNMNIDGGGLTEMVWHAGTGYAIIKGSEKFFIGDYFPVTIANDEAGKFSRYFTRAHSVQLPSSGSPTITDPS